VALILLAFTTEYGDSRKPVVCAERLLVPTGTTWLAYWVVEASVPSLAAGMTTRICTPAQEPAARTTRRRRVRRLTAV
jgi:hypothetical protein